MQTYNSADGTYIRTHRIGSHIHRPRPSRPLSLSLPVAGGPPPGGSHAEVPLEDQHFSFSRPIPADEMRVNKG